MLVLVVKTFFCSGICIESNFKNLVEMSNCQWIQCVMKVLFLKIFHVPVLELLNNELSFYC